MPYQLLGVEQCLEISPVEEMTLGKEKGIWGGLFQNILVTSMLEIGRRATI